MEKPQRFLSKNDPILKDIIEKLPPLTIENTGNIFHDLVSCITEQQIHYRSSKKMFKKMMDQAGLTELNVHNFSIFEEKGLVGAKLSEKKYETLLSTLEFFQEDSTDWLALSNDDVRTNLKEIKGIGPWTMDMVLIYTLQREDIFPADDYHLKKIMTSLYGLNEKSRLKAQMKEVAENWKPYRSLAVRYLLAWKDELKK